MIADLPKAVDKKTDKYSQESCNPNKVLKNLEIEKLNSPVCEQAFKWLNEFKKIKANPLNIDREMILTEMKTKIISKDFDDLEMEFDTRLVLNEKEKTFENCYTEREGQLKCKFCAGSFKKEGI